MTIPSHHYRYYWFLLGTLILLPTITLSALAQELGCSAEYQVSETLSSGARWDMCWEHKAREGIILHDIHYTPPNATTLEIINQASIAQIHVPYDDNGARYHDVSDYGLGDNNLNNLTAADCPDGHLLQHNGKQILCQITEQRGLAYASAAESLQGEMLRLFSVSHVGEYNYIPEWRFYDDGTIEPVMGATGALQRRRNSTYSAYGWPLDQAGTIGISHIHNYYWRLDFDLAGTAENDFVEELEFVSNENNRRRHKTITPLNYEAARSVAPERMRSWRIVDGSEQNADGHAISYHLEPLYTGHRDIGPSYEPWTFNDFYVTTHNSCEKYISHNPAVDGCRSDVSQFVNGQSLIDSDIVVWYGVTFHHIPRSEDEPRMHAHWSSFTLTPRDWTATNPLASDSPNNDALIYVSSTSNGIIGNLVFTDEDILAFNTANNTWSLHFDGSDVGLGDSRNQDIDAFFLQADTSILFSVTGATSLPDVGEIDDSDIIRFIPNTLGSTTAGSFELYFDGSDVGLTRNSENIDAIHILVNGDIIISTKGNVIVGNVTAKDEDLLRFAPNTLGANTSGYWSVYLDGSNIGLDTSSSEDIYGVWVDNTSENIYLSTRANFTTDTGLNGTGSDIFGCTASTTHVDNCSVLHWQGGLFNYGSETIDGFHIIH